MQWHKSWCKNGPIKLQFGRERERERESKKNLTHKNVPSEAWAVVKFAVKGDLDHSNLTIWIKSNRTRWGYFIWISIQVRPGWSEWLLVDQINFFRIWVEWKIKSHQHQWIHFFVVSQLTKEKRIINFNFFCFQRPNISGPSRQRERQVDVCRMGHSWRSFIQLNCVWRPLASQRRIICLVRWNMENEREREREREREDTG